MVLELRVQWPDHEHRGGSSASRSSARQALAARLPRPAAPQALPIQGHWVGRGHSVTESNFLVAYLLAHSMASRSQTIQGEKGTWSQGPELNFLQK